MAKIKNILILAGGDGSRFWPFQNKLFFPFLGKSLLEHILANVKHLAENVVVVANRDNLSKIKKINPSILTSIQENLNSGMAGAVLSCKNFLSGETLILNGNDLFDPNILDKLLDSALKENSDFAFVAKKVKTYFPGGYLQLDNKGKLSGIIEKPDPKDTPSELVNMVIDYFKEAKDLIKTLESTQSDNDDIYEKALTHFIKFKKTNYVVYEGNWSTVKYPWHMLWMMDYFLQTLNNEVKLGKNVKIAKTAKIVGPCFIDDDTIIGDFTMIRNSHIGKNCLIGGYSEVTRSYLGDNVSLHRNYVGDSVIDKNVLFGAQAATANFRFDEKKVKSEIKGRKIDTNLSKLGAMIGSNSKIGVNSTILPGIKIGRNSFIGPGETIFEDIADSMFVTKGKINSNKHFISGLPLSRE